MAIFFFAYTKWNILLSGTVHHKHLLLFTGRLRIVGKVYLPVCHTLRFIDYSHLSKGSSESRKKKVKKIKTNSREKTIAVAELYRCFKINSRHYNMLVLKQKVKPAQLPRKTVIFKTPNLCGERTRH